LEANDAYDGDEVVVRPALLQSAKDRHNFEGTSSSGSSTLEGTASPPTKVVDEDAPLLPRGRYPRRSIISFIKASLIYQPRPIPFFNKLSPSNGTTIVILAFIGLNLFYTFFHINFTIFELFVLADRCSLVFVANLPLLYILAAKN